MGVGWGTWLVVAAVCGQGGEPLPPVSDEARDAVFEVVLERWVLDSSPWPARWFGKEEDRFFRRLDDPRYRIRREAQAEVLRSWPKYRRAMVRATRYPSREVAAFARWCLVVHGLAPDPLACLDDDGGYDAP